ncbi:hypothetical protein [Nocardia caishijiensis]|uniref:2-oxoglutarate-Fe(II)-dependent oxygenase superfamily protein n=1 Tax=Nocardia caishijiensis TaxID=184756 RepID=A0ABQ6YMP2_9NOCA|nr:hypothetical protein [Nocardia caishijiensis]KAF0847067.1 hypothetical protein FNL39_104489 [Nocardia caishijiensis]
MNEDILDRAYTRSVDIHRLASHFTRRRYVHLPGLVRAERAARLLESTEGLARRRVECGLENVSWDEQELVVGDPGYEFCRSPRLTQLIRMLVGTTVGPPVCWTSCYSVGEYINPHRDRGGTAQLLLCLKSPLTSSQGGSLILEGAELFLSPGDAVLFEATRLEHHTTPLVASEVDPAPTRTVLVARYYSA